MFKFAKYYVLLSLYRKIKNNIMGIMVSILCMIISSYIFSDIIGMMENDNSYDLIIIKWLIHLIFLVMIVFNLREILKVISSPFKKESTELVQDEKKERILAKNHLIGKSDLIIEKYKGNICKNI